MKKRFLSFTAGVFLFLGVNSNAFDYNIVNGDQMLGAVYDIKDFTPFQNKCVNFLYHIDYPNGGQYYVRNINMTVSGYPVLTELKQGQGFILNATGSCNVTINSPTEEIVFQGLTYKTIQSPTTNKIWLNNNLGADYNLWGGVNYNPYQQAISPFDYKSYYNTPKCQDNFF